MMQAITKFCLLSSLLLVAGCTFPTTEEIEKSLDDGSAPPGSPPGYYIFKKAQELASKPSPYLSPYQLRNQYCDAAKLGYKPSYLYCVVYTLKISEGGNPAFTWTLCDADKYDPSLVDLCNHKLDKQYLYDHLGPILNEKEQQLREVEIEQAQTRQVEEEIKQNKYELQEEDF
ncbi:MAG: hypothetical protein LUC43_01810 [Burkholderiales bacterium]|nr:hypothetical protein [Burkholderiales bacterium]